MTVEEWRPVAGFPDYEVSSLGRVLSYRRAVPRILRGGGERDGYRNVDLSTASGVTTRPVHSLVAAAFLGPRPAGQEVRHLDGDNQNNAARNLCYGTRSENSRDAVRHGTHGQARKTHCPQDHPYSPENTYVTPSGKRMCRTCRRNQETTRSLHSAGIRNAA